MIRKFKRFYGRAYIMAKASKYMPILNQASMWKGIYNGESIKIYAHTKSSFNVEGHI